MALDLTALHCVFNGGIGLYQYKTNDANAAIKAANYFNNAAGWLRVGDIIICSATMSGTPEITMMLVTANDGITVTVTDNMTST